ncbi:MAG: hypothetical protein K2P98_04920 [Neisseriaceae bacterium]|nr:hypothetical protein [Neisseriaceae bacterium]
MQCVPDRKRIWAFCLSVSGFYAILCTLGVYKSHALFLLGLLGVVQRYRAISLSKI